MRLNKTIKNILAYGTAFSLFLAPFLKARADTILNKDYRIPLYVAGSISQKTAESDSTSLNVKIDCDKVLEDEEYRKYNLRILLSTEDYGEEKKDLLNYSLINNAKSSIHLIYPDDIKLKKLNEKFYELHSEFWKNKIVGKWQDLNSSKSKGQQAGLTAMEFGSGTVFSLAPGGGVIEKALKRIIVFLEKKENKSRDEILKNLEEDYEASNIPIYPSKSTTAREFDIAFKKFSRKNNYLNILFNVALEKGVTSSGSGAYGKLENLLIEVPLEQPLSKEKKNNTSSPKNYISKLNGKYKINLRGPNLVSSSIRDPYQDFYFFKGRKVADNILDPSDGIPECFIGGPIENFQVDQLGNVTQLNKIAYIFVDEDFKEKVGDIDIEWNSYWAKNKRGNQDIFYKNKKSLRYGPCDIKGIYIDKIPINKEDGMKRIRLKKGGANIRIKFF